MSGCPAGCSCKSCLRYKKRIAELEKAAQRVLDGIVERGGTLVMLNSNDAIDALAALLLEE